MEPTLGRRYLVALVVALMCLGLLLVLGVDTTRQLRDGETRAEIARELKAQVDEVQTTLFELEASQRGYLLTGRDSALALYRSGSKRLAAGLERLAGLAVNHPDQSAKLARFRDLVQARLAQLDATIALAVSQGMGAALAAVDADEAAMSAVRAVSASLHSEETLHLKALDDAEATNIDRSARFALALGAVIVVLLLAVYVLIRRDQALRLRTEEAEGRAHAALEQRVQERTASLEQAQAELASSHADLQRLVARQDSVQEDERKRVSRELHDELLQTLAAIRIEIAASGKQACSDPARATSALEVVDALAASAVVAARRIVNDLRPQMIEDLGLVAALETLASQFQQRTGIACELQVPGDDGAQAAPSQAVASCLYRVAQESLNNVAQHAQASAVKLQLTNAPAGRLVLRVDDDGRGLAADDRRKPQSFGLLGMQERVRAIGGVLRIDSEPGGGTRVQAEVPLAAA